MPGPNRKTRKRIPQFAATALRVAAIYTSSHEQIDDLARQGLDFITKNEEASIIAESAENLGHSKLSVYRNLSEPEKPYASVEVKSSYGPVTFKINQSDEISDDFFHVRKIPFLNDPDVNGFNEREMRQLAASINEVASTRVGMEMINKIAVDFSGEVQISRFAKMGYRGLARADHHSPALNPKDDYGTIRIGINPDSVREGKISTFDLNRQGSNSYLTTSEIIVHEIGHTLKRDEKSYHLKDKNQIAQVEDEQGQIKDYAMNWQNRFRREVNGLDPNVPSRIDTVLYQHKSMVPAEANLRTPAALREAENKAMLENYAYLFDPGLAYDQRISPTASSIGALKLTDQEYARHVNTLAVDALLNAGWTGDSEPLLNGRPEVSLSKAIAWYDAKDASNSEFEPRRRIAHELTMASDILQYRRNIAGRSINGTLSVDATIDRALQREPELAIELLEFYSSPNAKSTSIAAARAVLAPDGAYDLAKNFLETHDQRRKQFALSESRMERGEYDGPLTKLVRTPFHELSAIHFQGNQLFDEDGRNPREVKSMASATITAYSLANKLSGEPVKIAEEAKKTEIQR